MIPLTIACALVLDRILGEPVRYHPLVGFGKLADIFEERFNLTKQHSATINRFYGCISLCILVIPFIIIAGYLSNIHIIFDIIIIYLAVGWKSLIIHARKVTQPLQSNNIEEARRNIGMLVSRDTHNLQKNAISKACVESVLENGNDSIFGILFWYVVAGIPGVIAFRLINTLDAMWGYRNKRFLHFGWAAAKLDDYLNYIPARLTALSYALAGNFSTAVQCWKTQGERWKSANAGSVMAAGAGSIEVTLGGDEVYHGKIEHRPQLGSGDIPAPVHVEKSLRLIARSIFIWLAVISGVSYAFM